MSQSVQPSVPTSNLTGNSEVMQHDIAHTIIEGVLVSSYVFVLFIIITSRSHIFKTAFYVMFVAIGCADVFSILASCTHRLNRQLGWGPEYKTLITVAIIASGISFLTHMIGNMLLTINRYSALCLMKIYDRIWTQRNVCIMIGIQYVVAFAAFSPIIGASLVYKKNDDGSYAYVGMESSHSWRNRYIYLGGSFFYAVMSVCFNTRLFVEWRRLAKFGGSSGISRHEKGLLFYTALVFVSTMLMCLQQITKVIGTLTLNENLDLWATMQFFWINDFMVCVPPFCLLLLSAELRKDIVNFFLCKRNRKISTVSVSIFNNRQSTMGMTMK
ncbi:hypothetical protein GCK32_010809 [Trichostrongylus colubriformis]|uniref:Serpentine receptor class gamma n=1 Tax=Trichostrongylus colubriformis TaxID=6319 RepID=A0AAN8FTC0_TRICO